MYNFLKKFDGTGRKPRPQQKEALEWLSENWDMSKIDVISAPVGSGKSSIARAVQMVTGAHVITPSNILVSQYHDDFPNVNVLKGKTHYQCTFSGLTCADWQDSLEQKACATCPYVACKSAALKSEPTFFNPISLYYTTRHADWTPPNVLIVDEAHQLSSMILMLTGTRLRKSVYKFDERVNNELFLIEFLKDTGRKLKKLADLYAKNNDFKKMSEVSKEYESINMTRRGLEENAQNYAIWLEDGKYHGKRETFLNIKPIQPPKFVTQRLLAANKLILMSGTILPLDVSDLLGDQPYRFLDLSSPIPKEARPVYYKPVNYQMNWQTDPKKIVASIEEVLQANPDQNTIIHVPYSMSAKLLPHFKRPILHNTAETKDAVLAEFKRSGGVLLAAGMAEGIDLKDGLCRLNIIPKMSFPNMKDHVVSKRMKLEDGNDWFESQTLKTLMQQVGRSTRGVEDFSKTYVLDPSFARLFRNQKSKLPESFKSSIIWTKE